MVNKTCGLHVHHNARDFRAPCFQNLFNLYAFYEGELDGLCAESRRLNNNSMCKSMIGANTYDRGSYVPYTARTLLSSADRYFKLNLTAYGRHGTVEFRQMNGTIDAEKICGWVVLTQAIVERAVAARSVRKATDKNYNLFWAVKLLKTKEATPEQAAHLAQIREWVKVRKAQLLKAA